MKRALLFPGQGSQHVGMARSLYLDHELARRTFAEAEEAIGGGLSRLCFQGPEEELRLTENAQPAILTASVAALRVLDQELDLEYDWVAGHSLGEYSALVAAGALDFSLAVRAVRLRGQLMQSAVAPGAGGMEAVVGLDAGEVEALCRQAAQGQVLSTANLNGGGQVVVAGHAGAVARLKTLARERGAKGVIDLNVSAPFHCALMEPAARGMEEHLRSLRLTPPRVPVVTNVEALPCRDPERLRQLLVTQMTSPVRWEDCMRTLARLGCTTAIEVGPGRVLTKLARRIGLDWQVFSASDSSSVESLRRSAERAR